MVELNINSRLPDWVLPQAGPPRLVGFARHFICAHQLSTPNRLRLFNIQRGANKKAPIKGAFLLAPAA